MVATCTGIPGGTADWSREIGNGVNRTRTDAISIDVEPTGTGVTTSDPTILSAPVNTRAGYVQSQGQDPAPDEGDSVVMDATIVPTKDASGPTDEK